MNRQECLKSLTVLYVEDDDLTRSMVAQILTRWVGKLHLAADGQEGLYLFTRYRPDVVVTDIQMPIMDGLKMSHAIKEMDRDTPVIVTTAFNDQGYFLQAIEIGIDRYLAKPINAEHLIEAIARSGQIMLERRELQHFHEKAEEELKITHHLMRRMMLAEGLKDPALRYQVQPATRFSGDLVGAARAADGSLFTLLADATGHGLPAAINLLPLVRVFYKMVEKGFTLSSIVAEMNSVLKDQIPPDRFVATTLVHIDTLNRTIEAWNGGNPAVLFVSDTGEILHTISSGHPPLGILTADAFDARTAVFQWQTPGQLLMCSDGLLEAENATGEMFGQERLAQALSTQEKPTLFESVLESVETHLGDKPAHDDISLIVINCRDNIAKPASSS